MQLTAKGASARHEQRSIRFLTNSSLIGRGPELPRIAANWKSVADHCSPMRPSFVNDRRPKSDVSSTSATRTRALTVAVGGLKQRQRQHELASLPGLVN
jgi:hypothetical protein